jgi:hypothetical protein
MGEVEKDLEGEDIEEMEENVGNDVFDDMLGMFEVRFCIEEKVISFCSSSSSFQMNKA